MPGPLSRGRAWVENLLSKGVPEVNSDSVNTNRQAVTEKQITVHDKQSGTYSAHDFTETALGDIITNYSEAVVQLPAGELTVNQEYTINDDILIRGIGVSKTTIVPGNDLPASATLFTYNGDNNTRNHQGIAELAIRNTQGSQSIATAVDFYNLTPKSVVENVRAIETNDDGMIFRNGNAGSVNRVDIRKSGNVGLRLTENCIDVYVFNSVVRESQSHNMVCEDSANQGFNGLYNSILNFSGRSGSGHNLLTTTTDGFRAIGNRFENSPEAGWQIDRTTSNDPNAQYPIGFGNVYASSNRGIRVDYCDGGMFFPVAFRSIDFDYFFQNDNASGQRLYYDQPADLSFTRKGSGLVINGQGRESGLNRGDTPTAADYKVGDTVINGNGGAVYQLKEDGTFTQVSPPIPASVATYSGSFTGQQAIDDGTNTPSGLPGIAVWDDANFQWVIQEDGSTVTP